MALYSHYFTIRTSLDFINGVTYRQTLKFRMHCNGMKSVSISYDSLTGIYSCKKLLVQRRKLFSLLVELVEIIPRRKKRFLRKIKMNIHLRIRKEPVQNFKTIGGLNYHASWRS